MEAIEFVKAMRERVIEDSYKTYQELLETPIEPNDLIWKEFLPLYQDMTKGQQDAVLNFVRLIQVNTVSHIFGILDGSSYLNESRENFILSTEEDENLINGELQDLLLEMEE